MYSLYTSDDYGVSWDRITAPGELSLEELRQVIHCLDVDTMYIVYGPTNSVALTNCIETGVNR